MGRGFAQNSNVKVEHHMTKFFYLPLEFEQHFGSQLCKRVSTNKFDVICFFETYFLSWCKLVPGYKSCEIFSLGYSSITLSQNDQNLDSLSHLFRTCWILVILPSCECSELYINPTSPTCYKKSKSCYFFSFITTCCNQRL